MACTEKILVAGRMVERPCVSLQGPPLVEKVRNFAKSAVKHLASGMPMCTQEQIDRRFEICKGCEFFQGDACVKCGCPLVREKKFVSKLSWANESCPVGKWGPAGQ